MFDERRIYPRVACNLPAELETSTGESIDVRIVNLSRGGFYVEGDASLVGLESPQGVGPIEIWLHFGLPTSALHCHCRVVYRRRHAHDHVGLGLNLISTDHQAIEQLDDFVGNNLQ